MKTKASSSPITRRTFLRNGAIITTGLAALSWSARAQTNKNSKLRLYQIGVGGIGALQRRGLKDHPTVEWAGFCDVDQRELDKIQKEFPNAWTLKDYREGFSKHMANFDAVIVDTPD
ncbi:MAG: oxidoreductase domain protein, partial [Verrucomicrobia bacterium]|nr:oxidoreductase domain protein [Verrucomicrobiota bacterium]